VPASIRQEWDRKALLKQTPPDILREYKNEATRSPQLVKAMLKAGVHFMAGSDGPDPYVFPGFSLHEELELLVQSGFTPAQALEAATTNPAIFMEKIEQIRHHRKRPRRRFGVTGSQPAGRHPQHPQNRRSDFRRQVLPTRRTG
jgi:hypothetical protein